MLAQIARISNQFGRNVAKSSVRFGSHGGVPGENLPFDINKTGWLSFHLFWFVGTGLAFPFLILRHQMVKN